MSSNDTQTNITAASAGTQKGTAPAAFCTPSPPPTHPPGGSLPLPSSRPPRAECSPPVSEDTPPGLRPGPRTPRAGISTLLAPAPPLPRPAPHKGPLSRRVSGLRFLKSYRRKPEEIGKNGERGGAAGSVGQGPGGAAAEGVPSETPRPGRASGAPREITSAPDSISE